MKRSLPIYFGLFLALALLAAGSAMAGKNVLVVTGISKAGAESSDSYPSVYKGIEELLSTGNISPAYRFVELHELPDDAAKAAKGREVVAEIHQSKPDLVIAVGDAAVKYIGLHVQDIPVVFSFMFGEPKVYGLPKPNITGVARGSYAADIWAMANKLLGSKTVTMFSKKVMAMVNISEKLTRYSAVLEKKSGVKYVRGCLYNTFEEWKQGVENCPADLIYLAYTDRILKDGKEMPYQELDRWTVENAKVPVIAASERDVAAGALYAIVLSEKEMGRESAQMALEVLNGTPIADIPIATSTKGKLVINVKTAQKMGVTIPYEMLSTAEKIYEQ